MIFWDLLGFFFWGYVFVAYFMFLIAIVIDVFRDPDLNGWMRVMWMILIVFVPFITALVYLISRGSGMNEDRFTPTQQDLTGSGWYSENLTVASPADEITKAKSLLDSGTISRAEFDRLKLRALALPGR